MGFLHVDCTKASALHCTMHSYWCIPYGSMHQHTLGNLNYTSNIISTSMSLLTQDGHSDNWEGKVHLLIWERLDLPL